MVVALMCFSSCSGCARVRCAPPRSTSTRSSPSVTDHCEHAPVPAALGLERRFAHHFHDSRFFAALDDHQRHAGSQQGLQFSGGGEVGSQVFIDECCHGRGHFNKTPSFGAVFPRSCDVFVCHDTAGVHAYNSPLFRRQEHRC